MFCTIVHREGSRVPSYPHERGIRTSMEIAPGWMPRDMQTIAEMADLEDYSGHA